MMDKDYVFISYSSTDSGYVQQLVDVLKECQIAYWKAPEMIPAGSNYAKEIPKAIRDCSVFLLVLSGTSQNSIWVEKEVDAAICNHKQIIPVKIDDTSLNDMFRFYLNNVQTVEVETKYNMPLSDEMCNMLKKVFKEVMATVKKEATHTEVIQKDNIQADMPQQKASCSDENAESDKKLELTQKSKLVQTPESDHKRNLNRNQDKNKNRNLVDTRSNAFRLNKVPIQCEYCGGLVKQTTMGVYHCVECNAEHYDDLQKVRNFLEEVGTATPAVISKSTGVSIRTIEYFWQNDLVDRPRTIEEKRKCSKCGAVIEVGYLCESCRLKQNRVESNKKKGVWHSEVWRK